jgi:hypothetical protein
MTAILALWRLCRESFRRSGFDVNTNRKVAKVPVEKVATQNVAYGIGNADLSGIASLKIVRKP